MTNRPVYELQDGSYKECKTCLQLLNLDMFPYHDSFGSPWKNKCEECLLSVNDNMKKRAQRVKSNELKYAHLILSRIGYELNSDIPIHQQFNIKHGFTD